MTRTDRSSSGALVVLFALIAGLVGAPGAAARRRLPARPSRSPVRRPAGRAAPVPRGHASATRSSVSPLTARTPGRPRPGGPGLLRAGPQRPGRDDRARTSPRRWTVDADRARPGRSSSAPTRAGTTASRSPPTTSPSPSGRSRTPTTPARRAGSWQDVTVETDGALTVVVHARRRRSAGSSRRRPSRSRRPTCWPTSRSTQLADDPFGRQPIGSGPFALVEPRRDDGAPSCVPAAALLPADVPAAGLVAGATRFADDARPRPPARAGPVPYLAGIEFRFFDDADALAAAYRDGRPRRRLGPAAGRRSASSPQPTGSRMLRYPGSTLTAVLFNLRPGQPAFATPGDPDGAARGDRPAGAHRRGVRRWPRARRTGPDPADLAAVRPGGAAGPSPYEPRRRPEGAQGGRLDEGRQRLAARRRSRSRSRSSCSARTRRPTRPRSRPPRRSRRDWKRIGLAGHPRALPPGEFVTRAPGDGRLHGRRRRRDDRARPGPLPAAGVEPDADRRLERHRPPGSGARQAARRGPRSPARRRRGRPPTRRSRSSWPRAATSSRWPSRTSRSWSATRSRGPGSAPGRRPVGSILGCANMAPRR